MPRIVIFANGLLPDLERARALLRTDDVLICADGGSQHVLAMGLQPSVVIGDLDSMAPDVRQLIDQKVTIIQHPHDKDETDLELALRYAVQEKPSSILIIGALGKRLDQTLGNIALLSDPWLAARDARLDDGVEEAFFCREHKREQAQVTGAPGDFVSLLPWDGAAAGVVTEGLRWPLHGETLHPERTRGISNEMLNERASVRIESGLLLIVHRRQ
jgi:thiamine pyrophosphokinase